MLCQLTVKNGIDDETITWAANFIIEHIKNKDTENMDICLSIIVDILLYDKDLSASLLRIYQSLLGMSNINSGDFTDDNPNSAQIVTILKALFDMFCILDNYGLDCFEDYSMKENANGELVENYAIEENDRIRVKLSNYLIGAIIKKFLFCCNIHIRYLCTQGIMKILLENNVGNPPENEFPSYASRIFGNQSLYW
jgi:hypothetical protein